MRVRIVLTLLVFSVSLHLVGQTKKSGSEVPAPKIHSAHKATIYSAVLPGLGQFYNQKYWKIPVVYAGIGTIYYFANSNAVNYRKAREAYDYVSNGYEYPIDNDLVTKYSETDLQQIRDYYRRNMELSWILMGLWYTLNIIDATVDAHLFDYDINEDLTLRIEPELQLQRVSPVGNNMINQQLGIQISVRF